MGQINKKKVNLKILIPSLVGLVLLISLVIFYFIYSEMKFISPIYNYL